jgi:type I restriction enzyme, S subunit
VTTLEHYAEVNPAQNSLDRASLEPVTFVPMAAVSEEGRLVSHETRPLAEVAKGYTYFERGDILMAKITPCMENGKAALLDNLGTDRGFGSTEFHVLRPRPGVDSRFLFYLIWSQRFRDEAAKNMTGSAGQKRVPASYLKQAKVRRVTHAEQRHIADILDKANVIRRKRKEAIALTEELLRSAFLEMFGDPVTNPKRWPSESIEDLCSRGANLVDGPFGSTLKPEHYVSTGVQVVRNWNIYDDRFDATEFKFIAPSKFEEIRRSEVVAGDVLITTKGTVGDICVAPDLGGPAVLSASGTARLRVPPDGTYLPEFVVAQMTVPTFKRYLHTFEAGSAQQYLNLSAIRKMRLIRPPEDRQRAFSRLRERLRATTGLTNAARGESDRLFASLVEHSFAARST